MRTAFLPIFLAFAYAAAADVITLKNGEKLTGKVRQETDKDVTMNVQLSESISDERTIPRSEIALVEKDTPDEIAWREAKNLKPDPTNSFAPETYDRALGTLRNFQNSYPKSPHAAEVQEAIDTLEKERVRVADGQVKYLGQWLSRSEAEKRNIQIQAQQFFATMREQAASGDFVTTLNTFDAFEKSYSTTRPYPDAIELAKSVLPRLQQMVANRTKALVFEQQQFQKELSMLSGTKKSDLIAAEKREQAGFDAALASNAKSGAKWPVYIPRSAKSLDLLQKTIAAESARLKALPVQKMRESIANVDVAKAALLSGALGKADTLLATAEQLWPQNEATTYWKGRAKELRPGTPAPATAMRATTSSPANVRPQPPAMVLAAPALPSSAGAASAAATSTPSESATPSPSPSPESTPVPIIPKETIATMPKRAFFLTLPGGFAILGIALVLVLVIELVSRSQTRKDAEP